MQWFPYFLSWGQKLISRTRERALRQREKMTPLAGNSNTLGGQILPAGSPVAGNSNTLVGLGTPDLIKANIKIEINTCSICPMSQFKLQCKILQAISFKLSSCSTFKFQLKNYSRAD